MLKINPKHIKSILSATQPQQLYGSLQAAIELEHSTIPIYLTAFLSIKTNATGSMPFIRDTLQSVFLQEMLHMAIACNVLNAIGGAPQINKPGFIPTYPGYLPMVGDFEVHLAPLSLDQLNVFLEIEEPEAGPLPLPVLALMERQPEFATIGQFYHSIIEKIKELGNGIFTGAASRQLTSDQVGDFDGELIAITNVEKAEAGLRLIVDQGEGTSKSPVSPEGKLAHYYSFEQIVKKRKAVPDATSPWGYSYSGDPISLDQGAIEDMVQDPKASQFATGSPARQAVDAFNRQYSRMLDQLHTVFNGSPKQFDSDAMSQLLGLGGQVVATVDQGTRKKAAPSFEYMP